MGVWSLVAGKLGKAPLPPQESAPAIPKQREKLQKYPNKLSKPKTNSSGNLLSVPSSTNASRKGSTTDLNSPGGAPRRSSSVPSRSSPRELDLQHSQTLGERRLTTAVTVSEQTNGGVGMGRGRPLEREGREKKGRLSHLFRSRSSQAVPPDAKAVLSEMQQEQLPNAPTQAELNALAARTANPLHRYSQHTRPVFPQTQHGSYNVSRESSTNSVHRASSYAPYHTHGSNRLSLVPEQVTPLATPAIERELQLQHISETEDILTGRANSNASRRQSMLSVTSSYRHDQNFNPSRSNSMRLDSMTRINSSTRLNSMSSENSEACMPPPIRRRSLMIPGMATRPEDPKYPLPRQKLQKEPPVRRMSVQQPPTPVSNTSFFTKITRSQTLPSDAEAPEYYDSDDFPRESPSELLERLSPLEKPTFPTFRRSQELKRVNTPNDLGHIGGFQLGSLRITNGEASPSQTPQVVEPQREVDYFHLQRAALSPSTHAVSDAHVRTMKAISTGGPAELSAMSPERKTRPHSQGHSFSFEQYRPALVDNYDDSKILELRPPPFTTSALAESYRLELDFTSPFMEYDQFVQIPAELETGNQYAVDEAERLAESNGRRQGDELFLPQGMRSGATENAQENKLLHNALGLQNAADRGLKTDSGYSSHASLQSLQDGTQRPASYSPAPPSVPEKTASELQRKGSYAAYSAKSVRSTDSERTARGAMSPLPAEPEAPQTPPKESERADFWNTTHPRKAPRPISKVEDLSRKPVAEVPHAAPERVAPQTPQHERGLLDHDPTPRANFSRPPIPKTFFVEPQNLRSSSDTAAGADAEPIKVVRYTSVKEGPKPSLTDVTKLRRQSTNKVLQKATGRPPLAVRPGRSGSHAGEFTQRKRSDSLESLQSLRNMISAGSRRGSRSNSVERGASGPPAVQKVEEIAPDYSLPAVPKGAWKERSNRFSISHAKNLWTESEEVKMEKESEKAEKEAEKVKVKEDKAVEKEKIKGDKEKVKAEKREKKAMPPPVEEIEKSIRRRSMPAATRSERAFAMLSSAPDPTHQAISDTSQPPNGTKTDLQIRKEFEQEITSFENVAGALGASPYDLAAKASVAQSSGSASDAAQSAMKPQKANAAPGPQRDQAGRIIGMDEASASQFARHRSQIRAMELERREALIGVHGPPEEDAEGRLQGAFVPKVGNSNFARQLAAQASSKLGQKGVGGKSAALLGEGEVPPLPVFDVKELRGLGVVMAKSKKATVSGGAGAAGPPVSALNGIRKKNSGKGRQNMFARHRELSTQLEMPERFAPLPPGERAGESEESSGSASGSGSEKSAVTPASGGESATSATSAESSDGGAAKKAAALPHKPKSIISLFPTAAPLSTKTATGIDGILDAVLAPMTPSPTHDGSSRTSPSSAWQPSWQLQQQTQRQMPANPNIFNTRPPPPVSPATSTFSTSTAYFSPASPRASSPHSAHSVHSPHNLSPLASPPASLFGTTPSSAPSSAPVRPRLQSALSSRSSVNGGVNGSASPEKKRVAISTAKPTVMPTVMPTGLGLGKGWEGWKGPSPSELAEMAVKRPGLGARSASAQSSHDAKERERPASSQVEGSGRPKNEKRRSFGFGAGGGSKLKSSVEA